MKKRVISLTISLAVLIATASSYPIAAVSELSDGTDALLMSLTRETATLAEDGNKFTADGGVLSAGAELTAWDNNTQVTVGGTGKTPIVINNAVLSKEDGWRSANIVGIDNATAFEIKFSTTGYSDIRFSCTQKSTGKGPKEFSLAYRIGSAGSFTAISDSQVIASSESTLDSYTDLRQSYLKFELPQEVEDKGEVYLRVYVDSADNVPQNGNTSINDIRITSGDIDPYPEVKAQGDRPDHIIINQTYGNSTNDEGVSISHSFVELYNPTDSDINMDGMSLQYFKGIEKGNGDFPDSWEVLDLSGKAIKANSSFLIKCVTDFTVPEPRYKIVNSDIEWYIADGISNRAYSFALVEGTAALAGNAENNTISGNVIDLIGATNSAKDGDRAAFYESNPYDGMSKQKAVRRIDFADYDENNNDLNNLDYRASGISDVVLEEVRPRYSGDGAWGEDIYPLYRVPEAGRLVFSSKSGFYDSPITLSLTTAYKDGIIRYTTDGSVPTAASPLYENPILIEDRSGMPVYKRNFVDVVIMIRGTADPADDHISTYTADDQGGGSYPGFGGAQIESDGTFQFSIEITADRLNSIYGDIRISTGGLNDFTINDIFVYEKDNESNVLYDMQDDVDENWNSSTWGGGSAYISNAGVATYITGDPGDRVIHITERSGVNDDGSTYADTWRGINFYKDGLSTVLQGADISTLVPGTPNSPISKGTVVRAKVFDADGNELTAKTYTNSYFIGLGDNYPGFPVISLATDTDNLFDPVTGIYMNPEERGSDWERPVSFEIIEPDGSTHSQDMGVRIHGGYSRRYDQKSLRLYAKGSYDVDNPTLNYDIFDGSNIDVNGNPITEFQRILLRNTGNGQHGAMMRDSLLQDIADNLKTEGQAYRPSVVFINGEFWGYYEIRDRVDEYYYQDKFALDDRNKIGSFTNPTNDYDYPEELAEEPLDPDILADFESYSEMWVWFKGIDDSMTDNEYIQAQKYLDMDNFIDYWAYCMAIGNGDWPHNNLNMWRYRTKDFPDDINVTSYDDGRWRYSLRDLDFAFELYNDEYSRTLDHVLYSDYAQTVFIQKLLTNETFKERFIARACDILNTNLDEDFVIGKIEAFANAIEPVMSEQHTRWNNMQDFNYQVQRIKNFAYKRQSEFIEQLDSYLGNAGGNVWSINIKTDTDGGYIKVNTIDINTTTPGVTDAGSWSGNYLDGFTQTITAVSNKGMVFSHFLVNGAKTTSNPVQFVLTKKTTIEAVFKEVSCAGNHSWGLGEVTTEPTAESIGTKTFICTVCGEIKTEKIPAGGTIYSFGDVNNDGKITEADVTFLKRYLAAWQEIAADILTSDANNDKSVDDIDVVMLKRYLAKWSVTLGTD